MSDDIKKTLLDAVKAAKYAMGNYCGDYCVDNVNRVATLALLDAAIEAAEPKPAKHDRGMEMAREMIPDPYKGELHNAAENLSIEVEFTDEWHLTKAREYIRDAINARAEEVKAGALAAMKEIWSEFHPGSSIHRLAENIKTL